MHGQKDRSKDEEIKSLRGSIRTLDRKLKATEGALVELAGITDEKALKNEVKIAYRKFVKGEQVKCSSGT